MLTIIDSGNADKLLTKSVFEQGVHVTKDGIDFFVDTSIELGRNKLLSLWHNKREHYKARLLYSKANQRQLVHIVWYKEFKTMLQLLYPTYYQLLKDGKEPEAKLYMRFSRRNELDSYDISFSEFEASKIDRGWFQESIIPEEKLKAELQEAVAKSRADSPESRKKRLEMAPKRPTMVQVTRAEYRRNSDVVAEVMSRAAAICEGCGCNAPFIRASDGTPYLEVHHVLPLAEGGDDTVENAVALCPNCHRKKHFG